MKDWTALALGVLIILLWATFSSLTGETDPMAVRSAAVRPAAENSPVARAP
jgi:hypothetical protein